MSFLDLEPEEPTQVISKPPVRPPIPPKPNKRVAELEAECRIYVENLREAKIELNTLKDQISILKTLLDEARQVDMTSATVILDLVRDYMQTHPEEPRVQKALRHLPTNPEWEGKLGIRGGGWSGPWKDFAALLELALKAREADGE